MLKFDSSVARILDAGYEGADVTRRRRVTFDALDPAPGETIADIGCGNGLLTAELARAVGPKGRILAVDPSADMLAAAQTRCGSHGNVAFEVGTVQDLPIADGLADKAASVQVFEYIEDIPGALAGAMRCLRPGGRLVISDLHFGSLIWFSDDPDRMAQICAAWDAHFVSGSLPERLPGLVRAQGHQVNSVVPVTLVDHQLKPDGYGMVILHLMKQFALDRGAVLPEIAQAWFDEQIELARDGRFFFSITQFVMTATKVT